MGRKVRRGSTTCRWGTNGQRRGLESGIGLIWERGKEGAVTGRVSEREEGSPRGGEE